MLKELNIRPFLKLDSTYLNIPFTIVYEIKKHLVMCGNSFSHKLLFTLFPDAVFKIKVLLLIWKKRELPCQLFCLQLSKNNQNRNKKKLCKCAF